MDTDKYKGKKYKHVDKKINISKVQDKIKNPAWVSQHGFYPFIHFEISFDKYNGNNIKTKKRKIFYASHLDSFIYKYYGELLNDKYNEAAKCLDINSVATAYRESVK